MKLSAWRWLLDPATSILALRLHIRENGRMPYDAAWRLARVTRHPGDMVYRHHGHLAENSGDEK